VEKVNQLFSPSITSFAFPFTDDGVKTNFFNRLKKTTKVDLTFASAGLKKDKIHNHIHRISMDDYGLNAEQRLKTEYLYYVLKKPLGKNIIKRQ
jgi:hypothetical protein